MLLKNVFFSFFLIAQTCGNQPKMAQSTTQNSTQNTDSHTSFPYDLSKPSAIFNLDASLHEISGLTTTSTQGQLACIQDESGQLFYIDAQTGKSTPSVIFNNSGDFEGLEFVNDTLWATTSKGKLFKVWNTNKKPFDEEIIKIESLKNANIEGLAYDKANKRLLLASKGDKNDGTKFRTIGLSICKHRPPQYRK